MDASIVKSVEGLSRDIGAMPGDGRRKSRTLMNQVEECDRDKFHVVFCANEQYFQHTAVAAVSLLEAGHDHRIVLHVITSDYDRVAGEKLSESIRKYSRAELVIHRVNDSTVAPQNSGAKEGAVLQIL